jgi:UDP-N-acetylglucosamine--N-acetylmuramyl-(pentapeptide) pyrophosphoryl-undecaprenol N-acetylglucosamine transferase
MRAILAGGGTGGHVIPALAIAQALKEMYAAQVLFVGTARGLENRLVPQAGFALQLIRIGPLNKVSLGTRLRTLYDIPRSLAESRRILRAWRPDVVIGVGGYASGPVMLSAIVGKIPTLAFEPNYIPGFANRVIARWVSGAAVHFTETGRYFRRCRITGVPVRQAFFELGEAPASPGRPTLLVFGGSQGAHAINQAMIASIVRLRERVPAVKVIHQTGEKEFDAVQKAYAGMEDAVEVHRFIEDMPSFFGRAHLIFCRSGASTIAEITAAAKPAVFVPFPRAADDHQRRNAQALERAGAAVVLEESKLNPESLVETVGTLLADRGRLEAMGRAARGLSHPAAARDIALWAAELAGCS